jgi:flagella basal body P-ring formation protein FlgA
MQPSLQPINAGARREARGASRGEREKGSEGDSPFLPFSLSPRRLNGTSHFAPRASRLAFFSAFLLSALLGGGLQVLAFPEPAALDLLPAAQVDSAGIFLHQIAKTNRSILPGRTPGERGKGRSESGEGDLSPLTSDFAPPVRLTDAPAFGQAVSLSRVRIQELLKASAPELAAADWSGATQVRVTRRARALNERELRELLSATLRKDFVRDKGDLELRLTRPWASVLVPDETLVLKVIDLPATGVSAHFIVRFELFAGQDRLGPWQVVAQGKVMKDILVARTTLKRGDPLRDTEISTERLDVLSLREPLDEAALRNPSLELIESVQAGQPVLARSVRLKPVVLRGQFVDGLVREGALNIALKVEVLADGLPGQTVRVRNPKTKREFYAKVQDEQTVVINL